MRAFAGLAALAAATLPTSALARSDSGNECDDILPPSVVPTETRAVTPNDLVQLRDIGPVEPVAFAAPFFTVSPDGRRVAFQLRRADPARNRYCLAMVVMDLVPGARPQIVDRGGDPLLRTMDNRGVTDYPTGVFSVITPRWSPDGRWIAFLKREGGVTQVWRAMTDGSGGTPLTRSPIDVVDFQIMAGGSAILYATRPGLARGREANEREGLTGFHYDDRFWPTARLHPFVAAPVGREAEMLDLSTGRVRAATAPEAALITSGDEIVATAGAPAHGGSERLWISATSLTGGAQANSFHARLADGSRVTCADPACEGALDPWRMPDGIHVRFFRREGWARASTAIYEWRPSSNRVRRLYVTEDVLADCAPSGETLVCLRESSLEPRRLERFDPSSGRRQLLFDPNPEFEHLTVGRVQRLRWRNSYGIETLADLVLPVGYRRGQRYSLVVVQYDTRGFLRGGTGDEYPIQAFANRGYAVLSFRRPDPPVQGAQDFIEARRMALASFADRRSVHSSLEDGVRLAIDQGVADPQALGITGLSDGSTTAVWALLHSSLFSAVAMSSCCFDTTLALRVGPAAAREFIGSGFPGLLERDSPFWRELAVSVNAHRISTPILLQLSDDEYLSALESYTALREAGAPVDMFIFPGEHHVKWQPAHRLAIYRRSLDWFDYWLRDIRSADPNRQSELRHWDSLRSPNAAPPTP